MIEKIQVKLQIISGTLTAEQIASRIGIQPTRTWRIGDAVGPTTMVQKTNGWELSSGLEESIPLDRQLTALLQKVAGAEKEIADLRELAEPIVSFVIYCTSQPSLYLDPELVERIGRLKSALDFDVYWTT